MWYLRCGKSLYETTDKFLVRPICIGVLCFIVSPVNKRLFKTHLPHFYESDWILRSNKATNCSVWIFPLSGAPIASGDLGLVLHSILIKFHLRYNKL